MHWRKLRIWERSHDLALRVYRLSSHFPKEEIYTITSQIRRAATSVPANIVEGQSRKTQKEYTQYLFNARGSLEETRYYLMLAKDLRYLTPEDYAVMEGAYEEVSKMLNSLIAKIRGAA